MRSQCLVDALAGKHLLHFWKTPWNWRNAAEHNTRAAADLLVHFEDDRRAHNSMRPCFAIHDFVICAAHSCARRRNQDLSQRFIVRKDVFARRVLLRQGKELRSRERALAGRTDDSKSRIERQQRNSGVRRMHDVTRTAAENRVELILAAK